MARLTQILIETNRTGGSYRGGYISNITVDNPWDPLSKLFKRYTHTIEYSSDRYEPYKYSISVYSKSSSYSTFKLRRSYQKVEKVEVYFKASDAGNNTPLILGFIYENGSNKFYYTYIHLKNNTPQYYFLDSKGLISEKDLVTRLLEEVGPIINRLEKLVIRLDEQPEREYTYPDSGHYKDKKKNYRKKSRC